MNQLASPSDRLRGIVRDFRRELADVRTPLPAKLLLALRLIPKDVITDCREKLQ